MGETDHVLSIEADNPLKGWPDAFWCDGVRHRINVRPSLTALSFEQPFKVDGRAAVLVMSKMQRREAYGPRFKATLRTLLTLRIWRLDDALRAVDPWRYELLINGQVVALQPTAAQDGNSG
jgi:hypothetical protein